MSAFIEVPATKRSIACRGVVYGVGLNDVDLMTHGKSDDGSKPRCRFYTTWANLLKRCNSTACHRVQPAYRNATVCDDWLTFTNFRRWMELQDWSWTAIFCLLTERSDIHLKPAASYQKA
jgi:hypothetical protein